MTELYRFLYFMIKLNNSYITLSKFNFLLQAKYLIDVVIYLKYIGNIITRLLIFS